MNDHWLLVHCSLQSNSVFVLWAITDCSFTARSNQTVCLFYERSLIARSLLAPIKQCVCFMSDHWLLVHCSLQSNSVFVLWAITDCSFTARSSQTVCLFYERSPIARSLLAPIKQCVCFMSDHWLLVHCSLQSNSVFVLWAITDCSFTARSPCLL